MPRLLTKKIAIKSVLLEKKIATSQSSLNGNALALSATL